MIQDNLVKSKRTYTDIETNKKYDVYVNESTHEKYLIDSENNELKKQFYACAFDSVTIKLNTGKTIDLSFNNMYVCKEGESIIGRKFVGFKHFSKI